MARYRPTAASRGVEAAGAVGEYTLLVAKISLTTKMMRRRYSMMGPTLMEPTMRSRLQLQL